MKIPASVRALYNELVPLYKELKSNVDKLIASKKHLRWHYESRLKNEESFTLKLETGRVERPKMPDDLFACTLVVENHSRIPDAERAICDVFHLCERRPRNKNKTYLPPNSFDFDDLRLYVSWKDDPAQRPTDLDGLVFEVQIKTFLQHAWAIATHDLIYKTNEISWGTSRIAYQVKAMLENAELSISEAKQLTDAALLAKEDRGSEQIREMITNISQRWKIEQLPKDLLRLAQNVIDLCKTLSVKPLDLWAAVDEATEAEEGARTQNLSPFGAILAALVRKYGPVLFEPIAAPDCKRRIFVTNEIELPKLREQIEQHIVRPPTI